MVDYLRVYGIVFRRNHKLPNSQELVTHEKFYSQKKGRRTNIQNSSSISRCPVR